MKNIDFRVCVENTHTRKPLETKTKEPDNRTTEQKQMDLDEVVRSNFLIMLDTSEHKFRYSS